VGSPKELLATMKISSIQKEILIGTVLGDGFLQKTGEKNARLRLEHGIQQKEYLFWKVKHLQQFFQGTPKYLERIHPISGQTYRYWRHQSQSGPFLGKIRKIFYRNGIKQIPENIEKLLTPRSIAVWYMDDGYYYARDRCSYLYLGNVVKEDAQKVIDALQFKFNLNCRVLAKKKGFAVYFPSSEAIKLKAIIKNYVIDLFKYKLPS
jgi:hypothetical protein